MQALPSGPLLGDSTLRRTRGRERVLEGFTRLDACFACGSTRLNEVGPFRYPPFQLGFVPERWTGPWLGVEGLLVRCTACGSQGPYWRPGEALLREWYGAQDYTLSDVTTNGHLGTVRAQRDGVFGKAAELVDVGTGSGAFLDRVLAPMRASGLEMSQVSVEAGRARGRNLVVPDATGWSSELPERVDVITLFDVVEHVPHPREMLASLATHLKRPGWLVIYTGDASSSWARLCGVRWWYHLWAGHISCFSAQGLVGLLESLGGRSVRHESVPYAYAEAGAGPGLRWLVREKFRTLLIRSRAAALKDRFVTPYAGSPFGRDHMLVIAELS